MKSSISILFIIFIIIISQLMYCFSYYNQQYKCSKSYNSHLSSLSMMGGGPIRGDLIPKLISLTESSKLGLIKSNNNEIIEMMENIALTNDRAMKSDKNLIKKVNGNWKLLWTTEKETLFFAEKGLFNKKVTNIRQVIQYNDNKNNNDNNKNYINNIIEFEGNSEFNVLGELEYSLNNIQRVNFKFSNAKLVIPPFINLNIPPVGKGWFDNIYVNEKYRLSKDIRGDYLISKRIVN